VDDKVSAGRTSEDVTIIKANGNMITVVEVMIVRMNIPATPIPNISLLNFNYKYKKVK
jgi:hypothetical protein